MARHTRHWLITPRARDDLVQIARYTESQWGPEQRSRYLKDLESRFHWLAENPRLGRHRPDISEGYYCYPHGKHLIFYLVGEDDIKIIGVPHQEMDIDHYS